MSLEIVKVPFLMALMLCSLGSNPVTAASPVVSVVTFGDSWSDAGTFGTIYGTTPGSSWSQLLARKYGDDQTAYLYASEGKVQILGGLNYAQGGSKTAAPKNAGNSEDSIPHSAAVQIQNHLRTFGRFRPDQLIVLWIGTNDILAAFDTSAGSAEPDARAMNAGQGVTAAMYAAAEAKVRGAVSEQVKLVNTLLGNGASRLVVINTPDLGRTAFQPEAAPAGLRLATKLTSVFDSSLASQLPRDPRVLLVDADGILKRAAATGGTFTHVTGDACANGANVCGPTEYREKNADQTYIFAGYEHLTRRARQLLADAVAELVDKRWTTRP